MGYTSYFSGSVEVVPSLSQQEIDYLKKFNKTRRMNRLNGPYFVDGTGFMGQNKDSDVIDNNYPCPGQPGLWCQWVPTEDGNAIVWDEGEKFYDSAKWMQYIIDHFIGFNQSGLEFFTPHTCNGTIEVQGESSDDRWDLVVKNNEVFVRKYKFVVGDLKEI